MKKKIISIVLVCVFAWCLLPHAFAAEFSDVPQDNWSEASILKAVDLGIMSGYGNGLFGFGKNLTRAEFASMLDRLFHWSLVTPDAPTFTDNADKNAWYYDDVETAVTNGAVTPDGQKFRPNDNITREEMAVMLVRGLGYNTLAGSLKNTALPFNDVTGNKAYIAMAYDFGSSAEHRRQPSVP